MATNTINKASGFGSIIADGTIASGQTVGSADFERPVGFVRIHCENSTDLNGDALTFQVKASASHSFTPLYVNGSLYTVTISSNGGFDFEIPLVTGITAIQITTDTATGGDVAIDFVGIELGIGVV